VLFQADAAGDLTVALHDDPSDTITLQGDLSAQWWGVSSLLSRIAFGDGSTVAVGQPSYGQGRGMAFIWDGTAIDSTLTASGFGSNAFDFRTGPFGNDVINGFNTTRDLIQFGVSEFASFAALQPNLTATAGGTLVTLGQNSSVLLQGVAPSQLQAKDFQFG
jgi:hypothetical protein